MRRRLPCGGNVRARLPGLNRWNEAGKSRERIQTISADIPPEALADTLLRGGSGYFILDALTIRKSVLKEAGLMREDLRLHQDTEWILRVAMSARLLPGNLQEPVARWRVHSQNRISAPRSPKQKLDDRLLCTISCIGGVEKTQKCFNNP